MDRIFTFRYMWKLQDSDNVNFKIVSDTEVGLKQFEEAVIKLSGLVSFAREYLHEYDISRIGLFENLFKKDGD